MNITVLTSEKTQVRRKQIDALVEEVRAEFPSKLEYITQHDPSAEQAQFVKDYVKIEKLEGDAQRFNRYVKPLNGPQVSNLQKHLEALRQASTSSKPTLVLEDDAISGENYIVHLKRCLEEAPDGWDVIMLGLPGREDGFHKVGEYFPVLPVCDSYLVSPAGAKKIVDEFLPIRFTTNIQLTYVFEKAGVQAYMITPNVFLDASKYGVYVSTVSPNNPLILNRQYVEARMILRDDKRFENESDKVLDIIQTTQFKNHPDFMHLRALYEAKKNGGKTSEIVYSTAMKVFEDCHAILNNESDFLRDYISIFAQMQD